MKFDHLTPDQYLRQPWKNGSGSTTELIKQVVDGQLLWRLSIAEIKQSGPFSDFSGFDRTIMLLNGNGMALSFGDAAAPPAEHRIVHRYTPFEFAGEAKTHCRLIDGPVEDFNLMVDRHRARGTLKVLELSAVAMSFPLAANTHVLHCLQGRTEFVAGVRAIVLQAGETLHVENVADESTPRVSTLRALDARCSLAVAHIETKHHG